MIKKCISMVAVLTCLVFLTACGSEQKTDAVQQQPAGQTEKIETGMTAPDMELVAFDGKKEKLSALYADGRILKGRITHTERRFILFPSTWIRSVKTRRPFGKKAGLPCPFMAAT